MHHKKNKIGKEHCTLGNKKIRISKKIIPFQIRLNKKKRTGLSRSFQRNFQVYSAQIWTHLNQSFKMELCCSIQDPITYFFIQIPLLFFSLQYQFKMTQNVTFSMAIVLSIIGLLQNSYQNDITFQQILSLNPFPGCSAFFYQYYIGKYEVMINGATEYHHIVVQGALTGVSKTDSSRYKPDSYVAPAVFQGSVKNMVYIVRAPGFVKVQMAIFADGLKFTEVFMIATQFDRGYSFFQFYSNNICQLNITLNSNAGETNFNLFQSKVDLFSNTLQQYTFGSLITLPNSGKYYVRIRYNTSTDIPQTVVKILTLQTFSQNPCQNSCPLLRRFAGFRSIYQTTKDFCQCYTSDFFINQISRTCTQCNRATINKTQCQQMYSQICTNGIRQGSEECDNEGQTGCTNCTVETGYSCTENQFNLSSCTQNSLPVPVPVPILVPDSSQTSLSIEDRNKIIIGVCVGVGSAMIVGLGIFLLVKHIGLKNPVAISQNTGNLKQMQVRGSQAVVLQ